MRTLSTAAQMPNDPEMDTALPANASLRSIARELRIDHPKATMTARFICFEPARRVAVFSDTSEPTRQLCGLLKRLRFSPLVLSDYNPESDRWRRTFERFAELCIVDVDAIERFTDPFDLCRSLRRSHAHIPLIAISNTYVAQNLVASPERICDVSTPFVEDRESLADVISSAQSNCLTRRLKAEMTSH